MTHDNSKTKGDDDLGLVSKIRGVISIYEKAWLEIVFRMYLYMASLGWNIGLGVVKGKLIIYIYKF